MNETARVISPEEVSSQNVQERDFSQIPEIEVTEDISSYMSGEDLLDVKITSVGASITGKNGNVKNVSLKSLAKAIFDDTGVDTGFMPVLGKEYSAIKRYIQTGNKHILIMESSPGFKKVKYDRSILDDDNFTELLDSGIPYFENESYFEFNIPHPYIIFCLSGKEDERGNIKYSTSKVLTSKVPVFSEDTRLYKYPFSNVYEDYRVCWGALESNIRNRNFKNIMQFGGIVQEFFSNVYNDDLFNSRHSHIEGVRLETVFKDLHLNYNEYPTETLIEGYKMSEIISLLKNN